MFILIDGFIPIKMKEIILLVVALLSAAHIYAADINCRGTVTLLQGQVLPFAM